MKKWAHFYYWITLGVVLIALFGVPSLPKFPHSKKVTTTTKEQRTSHRIEFVDSGGRKLGTCTGTAIGYNAILTAAHCDEEHNATYVRFDLDTQRHKLLDSAIDGRDHIILLFSGSSFINIEPAVLGTANIGDTITIYGNAGGTYPAEPRYGKVTNCDDPSDVDAYAEQACYSFPVIPGDSGSAVFNVKGEIVGLVTYQWRDDDDNISGVGFGLDFTPSIMENARDFRPKVELPKPAIPSKKDLAGDSLERMLEQMFR